MTAADLAGFQEVDTPSLLLDLDILEQNLADIARFAEEQGVHWRPHIKTHKCVEIARRQLGMGACGLTVAKLSEAEVMIQGGCTDILVAYPIAAPLKLNRYAALAEKSRIILAIDSKEQAACIQRFLEHTGHIAEVWIKVDSGLKRCGVEPGAMTVRLAKEISQYSKLNLTGLFTHAGHSYAATSLAEIEQIGLAEGQAVAESARWCEIEGIPIRHRSVGSTPTFRFAGKVPGITEIRPGNAVFYDAIQVSLGVAENRQCALQLLASVVSLRGDRVILDTGSKSLALDRGAHGNATVKGFGQVVGHPELVIERLSEEHGIASVSGNTLLQLNDRVRIIPNHACTVANLFDRYILHRGGLIAGEWNIQARGHVL